MKPKLQPVTLDLSDELTAKLTLEAQANGIILQEWVTILVKKAINELPANPTTHADDNVDFNAVVFQRELLQAQAQSGIKIYEHTP